MNSRKIGLFLPKCSVWQTTVRRAILVARQSEQRYAHSFSVQIGAPKGRLHRQYARTFAERADRIRRRYSYHVLA